jgi:general secretion pathway protein J
MIRVDRNKTHQRVARQRPGEQGLTLIELLLSLAILVLLTGFLAGGLTMARRAFSADRLAQVKSETDAAVQAIAILVGSAIPAQASSGGRPAGLVFDGRAETVSFVGLSEGRSLPGGPYRISFRRTGGALVVELTASVTGAEKNASQKTPINVVAIDGVRGVHFRYFGRLNPAVAPIWRTEWLRAELLPELVSVQLDFEDETRNEPAVLIALRQG